MSFCTFLKRSVLLLVFLCACSLLPAQYLRTITVGAEPLAILPLGNEVHVLCSRVDANYNDTLDVGDVLPSWWVLDAQDYSVLRHTELAWDAWGNNTSYAFPFRPAVITTTDIPVLCIPQLNEIHLYNMISLASKGEVPIADNIRAISVDGSGQIAYCSSNAQPPNVIAYNMQTHEVQTIPALDGVQQTQPFITLSGKTGLLILNEGSFSSNTSVLQIEDFSPVSSKAIPLGNLGNSMVLHGDSVFVTVNGSHKVLVIDLNSESIVQTIETGTTGFGGPREAVVYGDQLFVTTYSDDVRRFSLGDGKQHGSFKPIGRPEGIALVNNTLWIADAYLAGTYSANNSVEVWNPDNAVDVPIVGQQSNTSPLLYPNPVTDHATLNMPLKNDEAAMAQVSIVSAMGSVVGRVPFIIMGDSLHARFTPEEFHLASGAYFVQISTKNRSITLPFTVVQ